MKLKNLLLLCLLNLTPCLIIYAQGISAVAGNHDEKKIIVRWFSQEAFNIDGVNIYRKEKSESSWKKLNDTPIKRMAKVEENNEDPEQNLYSTLIYGKPQSKEDAENWQLMQITKGILDEKFSKYFGMQYDDRDVIEGKTYEYKVMRLVNGGEIEGIVSNAVKFGRYIPESAPEKFTVADGNLVALFKWKTDKKKFFAFNIYKSLLEKGEKKQVNELPIFVFNFRDNSGVIKQAEYFYSDTSINLGNTYYYSIEGIDFLGRKTAMSNPVKLTPKDFAVPPSPFNIKVKVDDNKVTVMWQQKITDDLKGFNIYRSLKKDGKYEKINKTELKISDTSYTDVIMNPEPAYYYYVEAKNTKENVSKSTFVTAIVPDMHPPEIPEGLTGKGEVGKIILNWKMGTEKRLQGYYIYRALVDQPDEFLLLTPYPVKKNEYIDTLKKEHQNYFLYQVRAVSKNYVTSAPTKTLKVKLKDVTPPSVPFVTTIYNEDGKVTIKWREQIDDDLKGFDVYKGNNLDTAKYIKINKKILNPDTYLFVDSLLTEGTFYYSVTAKDTNGNVSVKSSPVSIIIAGTDTSLANVEGLKCVLDKKTKAVNINWKGIKKANLLGYIVYRMEEENFVVISDMIKENQFTDKEPVSGKNTYFIKAFDSLGNFSESEKVTIEIAK